MFFSVCARIALLGNRTPRNSYRGHYFCCNMSASTFCQIKHSTYLQANVTCCEASIHLDLDLSADIEAKTTSHVVVLGIA